MYKKILTLGVDSSLDKAEANRIILINKASLYPLFLYFFSTTYSIIFSYPRIVLINGLAFILTGLVWFLNYKHKYSLAKFLLITTHSFIVFLYYKLMMNEPGVYVYYLPIILLFVTFYSPRKEKKYLIASVISFFLFVSFCHIIPAKFFNPFPLSESLHNFIFVFCSITAMLLTGIYIYSSIKVTLRNESILRFAMEKAEDGSKAKALFLSSMSHELRTPLNGIIGTTRILQSEEVLAGQRQHLEVLKNLSDHMLGLVNNVLDYSKIDSGNVELNNHRFSLFDVFSKTEVVFNSLFKEKGIEFKLLPDAKISGLTVFFDELRLQQVLNNLIGNGFKFTSKGQVTLTAKVTNLTKEDVTVLFSVADTGIGISADNQAVIFDSFKQADSATTRKYGGTGLGLSISANLVKIMGGKLLVKSIAGEGSDFYFTITMPLDKQEKFIKEGNTDDTTNNLKGRKILLVEDNPINMMVARKALENWGITVTEAINGVVALQKFDPTKFDLVLIDLEMPEMDGKATVKEINKLNSSIPCLAFTAAVYENMQEDLQESGFKGYLLKPFKTEELAEKIVAALKLAAA
jgi:signal transduction histidine kinase/CheY-like chemotaxis protein